MKRALSGLLVVCVASLALATGKARADEVKPKTEVVAPGALTDASLKEMLVNLGYEPEETKSSAGVIFYKITIKDPDYTYVFYVSLTTDKSRVWIQSSLRQLPAADKVRADILEKLLMKNYENGPCFFSVKTDRWLYLDRAIENKGLTAKQLRQEIGTFNANIRSTESLWNPEKYPAPEKVIAAK